MRRLRITAYIVHHGEDAVCPLCGCPSEPGDTCYEDRDTETAGYCSKACAAAMELHEERYRLQHARA